MPPPQRYTPQGEGETITNGTCAGRMKHQGGSFHPNEEGETGAAVEVVTAWERTEGEVDGASPRRERQQVGRASQQEDLNEEPPYPLVNQLAHPHGGRMKRFAIPPDKARVDSPPRVSDSPVGVISRGEDAAREGEGVDGPASYLRRSYGGEGAAWESSRESSDGMCGEHPEGGAALSDEDGETSMCGELCPSNDALLLGDDSVGEDLPGGSLDERQKRIVYSRADEIISGDAGGGEDWLLSEVDEQPGGEATRQIGEAKRQIGEAKRQSGQAERPSAARRRGPIDRRALNLSAGELHAFLKRDKYRLTKMKTRMRNVVYRYLYERAKGETQRGERKTANGEACSVPNAHTLEGGGEAEGEGEREAENERGTDGAPPQDVATLLYTECTIRKTRIAKLRSESRLVSDRRRDHCMRILSHKNVYVFDGWGESAERKENVERQWKAARQDSAARQENPLGGVPSEAALRGSPPTRRFTCNNHFVCLQREDAEVHVFSHRVLRLNEHIFFKEKESKTTNEEALRKFLDDLTRSGSETNCRRVKLDWQAYPFYILRDPSWKSIRSIHLNALNHLCVCTEAGTYVCHLFFANGEIQIKSSGTYLHRGGPLLEEKQLVEGFLTSEKGMLHVSHCDLFVLHRNSQLFKGNHFTIVKHIKFRQRILHVSLCGEWVILSFSSRVSVHHKASGKVHLVVQVDAQGDVLGGEAAGKAAKAAHVGVPHVGEATGKAAHVGGPYASEPIGNAAHVGTPQQANHIPFMCPLEGDNLFCLTYGRKMTILEHSAGIVVRRQFALKHCVQMIRSAPNNILVTYGEKELHVWQVVRVKKELTLLLFFSKSVRDARCWEVHDEGRTFDLYGDALQVKTKLVKINRDDEVARRIVHALGGGATHGGAPNGDDANEGTTPGGAANGGSANRGGGHFRAHLLYVYILDGGRVDLVVVNSLAYLIYLLFSHHRYGLLLALLLHLHKGNACLLTDLPVDEDERREKLKPLFHFLFERRVADIIQNGNRCGRDPRSSLYHVQVQGGECPQEGGGKRGELSNGFSQVSSQVSSKTCSQMRSHTPNNVSECLQRMGPSSESTASASVDLPSSEPIGASSNEGGNASEGLPPSCGGAATPEEEPPAERGEILIDGRIISDDCIKELQKVCLLAIEISIHFDMDLYERMFQLLRSFGVESIYFHLIEEYIVRKSICVSHHSLVCSLTEHFKRLYRVFSEHDDSCYDVFLFFCSLVSGRSTGEHLNGECLSEECLSEERLSEVVFSPLGRGGQDSDESGDSGGDRFDRLDRLDEPCADLDAHLYRHHLGAQDLPRKIRRVYAFVCIVELFFRLFESINLEGKMEGIISHLPIHLSAFIYNKHNEDRITTAEFFVSYLIRKKNDLFYSFCRCNSLRSDLLPIYLPMYMYRNFYQSYFLFDYVFSVMFKVPFSISMDRFLVPLEGGITLRSCHPRVHASYQFDDPRNYQNVFFVFSPFRVERENHCTLNRGILSLWRYLLSGGGSGVSPASYVGNVSRTSCLSTPSRASSLRTAGRARCFIGGEGAPREIQMSDYFNVDKNGLFLLLQLSLRDTFNVLNRSFFQYDFMAHHDVVNLLVGNLCNFYLHMVITFIFYITYLRKVLQNNLTEETSVQIYREVLLAVDTCKDHEEVSHLWMRLLHVVEAERHAHVQKNLPNIVKWITLQLFYIHRHRKEMASSVTYLLILFFILQSDCEEHPFDYRVGVLCVNFLLSLSHGEGQNRRMNATTGRRRVEKLTKRCFHFASQNYLNKVRRYVREEHFLRTFRLRQTNLRVKKAEVRKNVAGASSPHGNLVNYLLGAVCGVDVPGLLRRHGADGCDYHGEHSYREGASGEEWTGEKNHRGVPHGGVTRPERRADGCAFKRVRKTNEKQQQKQQRGKEREKQEQKRSDIFCVTFCRRHYGYILLLYVKRLLVLHRRGRRERGSPSQVGSEEGPLKTHSEESSLNRSTPTGLAPPRSAATPQGRRRRDAERLLKYVLLFSHVRRCEPVYLLILNHFGRYDVVLHHYRARGEWRSMQAYIFANIFFFFKERRVKRRLRGYLFYGDVLEHVGVMGDLFVSYLLGNYLAFHNRTVGLLGGGSGPGAASPEGVSQEGGSHKGVTPEKQHQWGKTHLMSLCKLFATTLIRCRHFSEQVKQRVYYLLLHEAHMPHKIKRYLHKKVFYPYLVLLCKYQKDQVYSCVRNAHVERHKELFEQHGNVNVLLHLHERQGKFLSVIDLCLKLIKENILKLKDSFCQQGDWFVPQDVTYGDVFSVSFCSRVDVYSLGAMPLKRSVRRFLSGGGGNVDQPEGDEQWERLKPREDDLPGRATQRDSFLRELLGRAHSAADRSAWGSYFVKTPRWGEKPHRSTKRDNQRGTHQNSQRNTHQINQRDTHRRCTVGEARRARLARACRIFLTREYNAVFLYTYMLTFVLRRNKLQSDRINEYVLFFIVSECVRGFIGVCEQLGCGGEGERRGGGGPRDGGDPLGGGDPRGEGEPLGGGCLFGEKGLFTSSTKRKEEEPPPDAIAFFGYLFDQIVSFVANVSSHRHAERVCRQLLAKYRKFQVKLVRPPLIGLLKSMTEAYTLLSDNCHVAEKRIKRQIESYTFERKKGLVVSFQVDHTHPFNTRLCAHSKRGGEQSKHSQQSQLGQPSHPSQPSQPTPPEQKELLPESCTDYPPPGDALWLSKCEHDHHFACSQRCHLCGAG
ncbi:unnamed protein product [Plasmodium vivax]|uniref:(malaria parasite P. vivax) hypothetical protein n=1 Tax=Plasmodium vivax TaxID=5855 RepID=A0A8S4HES1_PLAVI|nr:unnamed protein product [Plasmodium vivax]